MGITFKQKGGFESTKRFFKKNKSQNFDALLRKYGELGVLLLQAATPKLTGKTASSWYYNIEHSADSSSVEFCNSNTVGRGEYNVALLIQYGHGIRTAKGTRTGVYVQGRDYINPALKPLFDSIAQDLWKEVNA